MINQQTAPHRYIDTEVFSQTSTSIHWQQSLWVKLQAVVATQTNQCISARNSNQTIQTTQEMLANEE